MRRTITPQGIALIKQFEGFAAQPYRCPGGYWTIGYGHVIRAGEYYESINEGAAEVLLRADVALAERAVQRLIPVPLSSGQFDALVSFTFNLGAAALQRSTLRHIINRRDYEDAPAEFRRWVWAGGRKWPGLQRRREAEILRYHHSG